VATQLTPEQRRTVRTVLRVGRQTGAPRKRRKAAVETIGVEANYLNPAGGSGSSVGAFQEIALWGPASKRRNVAGAARRFYRKAATADVGQPSYELAQDVQRSAFPGRYRGKSVEAGAILRHYDRSGGREAAKSTPSSPRASSAELETQRRGLAASYFAERERPGALLRLAGGLQQLEATGPPSTRQRARTTPGRVPGRSPGLVRGRGPIIGTPHAGTHTLGNWESDNAIDVRVPVGTPVYAPSSGTIAKTRVKKSMTGRFGGSSVTLQGQSNAWFYAHLSGVKVKPGQRVKKGQLIGLSGSANAVPHLHFGQRAGDPRRRRI
jgi:murein DD-endopeptidase MepM/ murein hydrolase activator NlpD